MQQQSNTVCGCGLLNSIEIIPLVPLIVLFRERLSLHSDTSLMISSATNAHTEKKKAGNIVETQSSHSYYALIKNNETNS